MTNGTHFRIAIVSGKLGGVDGVSLEVNKWIDAIERQGHDVHAIAGAFIQPLSSIPADQQLEIPDMRFTSEFQRQLELQVFPHMWRRPSHPSSAELAHLVESVETRGREMANVIMDYVKDNDIDVIVAQNTNAMPMTVLGGVAMYHVATTNRVATVFHHHDFWWERSRFSQNRIENLLNRIMPPIDLGLEHVVISSYAAHILASLKRVQPHVIPNCEDFDSPVTIDDYNGEFRSDMGFSENDILIVQPTRIVPRKRIEDSVRLVGAFQRRYPQLKDRIRYIISLYQGDEPDEDYVSRIREIAHEEHIHLNLIGDRVASVRTTDEQGRRMYTNRDVLANADLVTYLPLWEGFGNALLEAIAARVPIVTTTYLVYKTDIMTSGFKNIEVRDRYDQEGRLVIEDSVLEAMYTMLTDAAYRDRVVAHNFETGRREFGLNTLRTKLQRVFEEYGDEIRASRKRIAKLKARYSV